MGLDCSLLPFSKQESIGFGGTFKTRVINKLVVLTFRSDKEEIKIPYSSGFRVVCPPPNITDEEKEKFYRYTPSILGMDILSKFRLCISKKELEMIYLG